MTNETTPTTPTPSPRTLTIPCATPGEAIGFANAINLERADLYARVDGTTLIVGPDQYREDLDATTAAEVAEIIADAKDEIRGA